MNELQKDYFEKMAKEQAEAEAAEEARLLAVMESERKKDAIKQEIEKKAKEEAERKAEAEAVEIINRVKAEMASNKAKQTAEAKADSEEAGPNESETEGDQSSGKAEGTADKKKAMSKEGREKPKTNSPKDIEPTEEARTGPPEEEEERNIYEREPAGEASMPKKGPKFKKGSRKSGSGRVQSKPQEAAATNDKEEKAGKRDTQTDPEAKQTDISQDAEADAEETTKKTTPESKAASDREAKLQELAEEYQDKYKRLLAEFENARAREAKEASRMYDVGAKAVLEKLLPVVDNFERAIQTIPEEDRERAFEQGVDKIYKQMMTVLEEIGVQPMNAEGTEFNPDMHNAVMHVEDEAFGENIVAEEMQKGYMYKESVLRYSMVKVAN